MFKYIYFNFEFSKRLYVIFFQITLLVIYFVISKYIKLKTDNNKDNNKFIDYFSYSFNQNFFIFALILYYFHHRNSIKNSIENIDQNGKKKIFQYSKL